eukprot:8754516-Alexandrium_andersonii.AAC.1
MHQRARVPTTWAPKVSDNSAAITQRLAHGCSATSARATPRRGFEPTCRRKRTPPECGGQ